MNEGPTAPLPPHGEAVATNSGPASAAASVGTAESPRRVPPPRSCGQEALRAVRARRARLQGGAAKTVGASAPGPASRAQRPVRLWYAVTGRISRALGSACRMLAPSSAAGTLFHLSRTVGESASADADEIDDHDQSNKHARRPVLRIARAAAHSGVCRISAAKSNRRVAADRGTGAAAVLRRRRYSVFTFSFGRPV